jgi:hypothetical protein
MPALGSEKAAFSVGNLVLTNVETDRWALVI